MNEEFNNESMLELYLFELTSLLSGLDNILLEAEQSHNLSKADINEIFRIMHTIKGSSAMMAFDVIAAVTHSSEDIFSIVRDNTPDDSNIGDLLDLVLDASKFLGSEAKKIEDGAELSADAEGLINRLKDYAKFLRSESPALGPKPNLGRMLGGEQMPHSAPVPAPPEMPVAPEGGRILGIEPPAKPAAKSPAVELPLPVVVMPKLPDSASPPPGGENTVFLHVHFNEGAKMENIRALMLASKLSELGTVNSTIPEKLEDNDEATDIITENGFYISFTSNMFRKQIESVAKSTLSVESVSFLRKMPGDDPVSGNAVNERAPLRGQADAPLPLRSEEVQEPLPEPAVRHAEPISEVQEPLPEPAQNTEQPAPPAEPAAEVQKPLPEPTYTEQSAPPADGWKPLSGDTAAQLPEQTDAPLFKTPETELLPVSDSVDTLQYAGVPTKQNIISVDLTKLDSLLDLVGEIVINKSLVTENPDLAGIEPDRIENFNKAARQLGKLTDELRDSVMSVRLVPLQATFQKMRRGVRDMSKSLGKNTELVLLGETTEVDKMIIDAIGDPIMHLVRNAVDHAIEFPAERIAAGKTPVGHVTISAQNEGSEVIISVSDDGRGIDKERILAKAEYMSLLSKPASEYTDSEIHGFLMEPGFSTKDKATEYSGRGVGLDVVKMNIERIGGAVVIESAKGVGTNVLLKIPLTLAIVECMEFRIGKEIYAIPINNVKEAFKSSSGQFVSGPSGKEMMMIRGTVYPVVRLYERFGIDDAIENLDEGILLLADAADRKGCLLVDELIGKWQVAVKGIPDYLKNFGVKQTGISGCTITGNGNASLILDVRELLS